MNLSDELDPAVVSLILDYERDALVGRLLRGLVHNLSGAVQMARLPLDLLEIQLKKGDLANPDFTLKSIQDGMSKIFHELQLLSAKCSQCGDKDVRELDLGRLIKEQLEFWRADLFFKHDVKCKLQVEYQPALVTAPYRDLALICNMLIEDCLQGLRGSENPELLIRLWREQNLFRLAVEGCGCDARQLLKGAPLHDEAGEIDRKALRIYLIEKAAEALGGNLDWSFSSHNGIVVNLPAGA